MPDKKYITDNLDRAIAEGYIVAFYQPVARTLTGEICGMEALARWIDPEYGVIPPDGFIGVLEEEGLIHKLDCHIIHRICEDYAETMTADNRTVTISFNLSRLDFKAMDMHAFIEQEMKSHKVPEAAFRVEITESMMDNDDIHMHEVIDGFWDSGLRVWMDDFGSGYSSLNVLKDYRFDTLKIDMVFLRDFNARSREIVKSIVDMSKRIGVHTLAEGVETEEQFLFLKNIGCEKAQGYYIGKPLPYKDCIDHLHERGYRLESPSKRQYYHDIGRVNLLSAMPLETIVAADAGTADAEDQIPIAFVEYSDGDIKYLFANESYMRIIREMGEDSLDSIEVEFSRGESPLKEKFLSMILSAKETGETVGLDFIRGRKHCFAQVRAVADYPGGNAFLCILHNLSDDALLSRSSLLSEHMKSLCSIYEMITLVNLNTGYSETIFSSVQTRHTYNEKPATEELRDYAENEIYPEDRERFIEFTDLSTIEQRITESPTRHISAPFRTRITGGTYVWSLYSFLFDGDRSDRRILTCFRRLSPEAVARLHNDSSVFADKDPADKEQGKNEKITAELLWDNFRNNSDTGFFWKDSNRRFVGVNKKFLEYYGIGSEDELIGRTDEDMGWHVDPEPYKSDEEKVLAGEGQTYLVPGTCICRGEIRNIVASKIPLYKDGQIIGLMGYFIDVTDQKSRNLEIKQLIQNDPFTGALNFLGLMESLLKYQDGYAMAGSDFTMIFFNISHFHLFSENYGKEWVLHLLKAVAGALQKVTGVRGIAGRLYTDHFMLVRQIGSEDDAKETIAEVEEQVGLIREIDGVPCSIFLNSSYTLFSQMKDLQVMYEKTEKGLKRD